VNISPTALHSHPHSQPHSSEPMHPAHLLSPSLHTSSHSLPPPPTPPQIPYIHPFRSPKPNLNSITPASQAYVQSKQPPRPRACSCARTGCLGSTISARKKLARGTSYAWGMWMCAVGCAVASGLVHRQVSINWHAWRSTTPLEPARLPCGGTFARRVYPGLPEPRGFADQPSHLCRRRRSCKGILLGPPSRLARF
jgi:hypothetical protein